MIETLDQSSICLLNVLYNKLAESMELANKKLIGKSVFLTLLKLSNNDTYKIIHNSSVKIENTFKTELNILVRSNFVRNSDDKEKLDELVITAQGIWYIEASKKIIDLSTVLIYVQSMKLEFPRAKQVLSDNEKIIVYSMLAIRTFSEQVTMDLSSNNLCNSWQDIIENLIIPHLRERKIIKIGSVIDKKTGNEDPISYLLRHANDLPQKSNNLFVPTKKNKYYLSLNINDQGKCLSQLTFLLNKIIPEIESDQFSTNIFSFLCDVAHNQSLYVTPTFDFINNHWDKLIKDALEQLYLGIDISTYPS
ncbi:MAG: hypothetical protein ACYC3H_00085 [Bellilinea sp.]